MVEASADGTVYVLSPDLLAGHSWLYRLDKDDSISNGTEVCIGIPFDDVQFTLSMIAAGSSDIRAQYRA